MFTDNHYNYVKGTTHYRKFSSGSYYAIRKPFEKYVTTAGVVIQTYPNNTFGIVVGGIETQYAWTVSNYEMDRVPNAFNNLCCDQSEVRTTQSTTTQSYKLLVSVGVTNDDIAQSDYAIKNNNHNGKSAISKNNGEYYITVTNNTSSDISVNYFAFSYSASTSINGSSSVSSGEFLIAEFIIPTVTIPPSESKVFKITYDQIEAT